jgi:hypothetical protein
MMAEAERFAVLFSNGAVFIGFNSLAEANQAIKEHSDWRSKGAIATELTKPEKKPGAYKNTALND